MKPASDFTTPRRLIAPISRHFFPVEHPEPLVCTTGLKNGSRFPFIAHFFSSGLGCLQSLVPLAEVAAGSATAGAGAAAATFCAGAALATCLGSGFVAGTIGFAAGAFTT